MSVSSVPVPLPRGGAFLSAAGDESALELAERLSKAAELLEQSVRLALHLERFDELALDLQAVSLSVFLLKRKVEDRAAALRRRGFGVELARSVPTVTCSVCRGRKQIEEVLSDGSVRFKGCVACGCTGRRQVSP